MNSYPIKMERVFYRNPSEHIVLKATILQSYHKTECERALNELIHIHPRLSCTVEEDANHKLSYKTNPSMVIPINYFVGTRENDWKTIIKEELKQPFFLGQEPSFRICIVDNFNEFELIMIMHHMLGDGLSLLYTYQDFLNLYFHNRKLVTKDCRPLQYNDLPKDSRPNFITRAVIYHINHLWKKETPVYQKCDYAEMFQHFQNEIGCNYSVGFIEPNELRKLYDKSHEYNVTINSIIITALLYQLAQSPVTTKQDQKVIIATNLRNRLLIDPKRCIGNYAACISPMLKYDHLRSFWSNAKIIHNQIQKLLSSNKEFFALSHTFECLDTSIFDELFFHAYSDHHSKKARKVEKILKAGKKEEGFDISNLGRFTLEDNSKLVLVKDFVYLPPLNPSSDITVGVLSVSNRLCLTLLYDEKRFDHQTIDSILQCTLALLTKVSDITRKGEHNEKESESENVI